MNTTYIVTITAVVVGTYSDDDVTSTAQALHKSPTSIIIKSAQFGFSDFEWYGDKILLSQ